MNILNNSFIKPALPWILMLVSVLCLCVGYFAVEIKSWSGLFVSIGTAVLSGGVLTAILKSVQFLGIFKEELNSVIFETRFLRNRNDLPDFWEKVTKEFIRDRLPTIHSKILNDVKEQYLPTSYVQYYEDYINVIDIKLIDSENEIVVVTNKTSFTIVLADDHKELSHPFRNSLKCPDKCPITKCDIKS